MRADLKEARACIRWMEETTGHEDTPSFRDSHGKAFKEAMNHV